MVSKQNLARMNELADEFTAVAQAIQNLSHNGQIVNMTISGTGSPNVTVPTTYMAYPEQMIATIKSMLQARQSEIQHNLEEMGVVFQEPVHPELPTVEPPTEPGEPEEPEPLPPEPQGASAYRFRRTGP